ncbi:hypothetical protein [Streptomyces sp. NPDC005322]|uniref:hypothetical protein n=1 Tax=Streptomyces sp. NPDC005322 TaxID=3157032 RepID=UPI0033ADFF0C
MGDHAAGVPFLAEPVGEVVGADQALLRLARQRISVLFAMLRDGTFYETRTREAAAA